ncbi:MAG: hypothetical protein H6883_13690 [Rhodobiaceae bacterium]|nr:hypothetical protein [Rhodobiaceae bacterium]
MPAIRLVEQAQAGKAPVQRLSRQAAAVFVPVVLVIAVALHRRLAVHCADLATALSFRRCCGTSVIACPCALVLQRRAALVAGTGSAARAGILKDIEAPEHSRACR